jgi:phage protein D/phage baseplate assembly protein gpV
MTMNAGIEVRVNGLALRPEDIHSVRVEQSRMLPDAFFVEAAADWNKIHQGEDLLGAEIELFFGSPDDSALTSLVQGEILVLEPHFGTDLIHTRGQRADPYSPEVGGRLHAGQPFATLVYGGYDHSHKLNRTRRTTTFQNMTLGDIARKVASTAGFQAGTIDSVGPARKFVQQNNETDWEFLWRLARTIDFEVVVLDKKLNFRKAGTNSGQPKRLRLGEELWAFDPRISAVQQIDEVVVRGWDPQQAQTIEAHSRVGPTDSQLGISRDKVASAGSGGTLTISDRPIASHDEAQALADSLAQKHGNAFVSAEGACRGDPTIKPGTTIEIKDVAPNYNGTYTLSATRHVFKGGSGYETMFTVSGRTPHRLVDLTTPAKRKSWGNSVVRGVVTNNQDPDKHGRVRVNFPALAGDMESEWARVIGPAAGKDRGLMMLPQVGDEVVIAFEHDDVHFPYVIGSVWNGKGKPGDLSQHDGSFVLQSQKFLHLKSKDSISLKSDKDITIEVGGESKEKASKDISVESTGGAVNEKSAKEFVIEAGTEVKIKAGTNVTLEAGANLEIKANGMLKIQASGALQLKGSQVMLG